MPSTLFQDGIPQVNIFCILIFCLLILFSILRLHHKDWRLREGWKRNTTSAIYKYPPIPGKPSGSVYWGYQNQEKLQESRQVWLTRGVTENHFSEQGLTGIRSTEHRPTGSKPIEHGNARSSFIGLMLARSCRAGLGLWGGYPWGNNGWDVNNRWLSCWGDCYWSFITIIEL